jgi:hypothetical protein
MLINHYSFLIWEFLFSKMPHSFRTVKSEVLFIFTDFCV